MWHNNIAEKSSSRVNAPPGGRQQFNLFGGGSAREEEIQPQRTTQRRSDQEVTGKIGGGTSASASSTTTSPYESGSGAIRSVRDNDIFGCVSEKQTTAIAADRSTSQVSGETKQSTAPVTGERQSTRVLARPGGVSSMHETLFGHNAVIEEQLKKAGKQKSATADERWQTSSGYIGKHEERSKDAEAEFKQKATTKDAMPTGGKSSGNIISWT